MEGIVTKDLGALLGAVREVQRVEEAVALVKKVDALKTALESVDAFRKQAVMYARLEAEALMRVVELGGTSSLRGFHRKVGPWLLGLSDGEREMYIGMCEEGLTIDQVYKREVQTKLARASVLETHDEQRKEVLEEVKESGFVDLSKYEMLTREYVGGEEAEDLIDGTRNRLRKIGAVGCGDNIYVMPNRGWSGYVLEALRVRYKSIIKDIWRMEEIAKANGGKYSHREITEARKPYRYSPEESFVLYAMFAGGYLKDDELFSDEARKELYASTEMAKKYGIARDQVITDAYNRISKG